jgi:hypothetical protein
MNRQWGKYIAVQREWADGVALDCCLFSQIRTLPRYSLHFSASKPGDLGLFPMQPPFLCTFLFDMLYSYPRSSLRSSPSYCLAHCFSIARYSFMYLILSCNVHFPSLYYTSVAFVVISWEGVGHRKVVRVPFSAL